MASFHKLVVWQKAFALCCDVHRDSQNLPQDERFGLAAELRKTARSVVCNIAEGQRRDTKREFARFLGIARASAGELETQLLLCQTLEYLPFERAQWLVERIDEVSKMLTGLKASLRRGSVARSA